MKKLFLYLFILIPCLQGCVMNDQSDQAGPGWLFWVFLGLLLGLTFMGALVNLLRKKKTDDAPTKAEKEIEAYEETLNKKLEESSEEKDKEKE